MRKKLGRVLPWLVAIGILAFLMAKVSPRELLAAVAVAAGWTVPFVAAMVLLVYVADSFAMWRTFGWFLAPVSLREILVTRGATYLLALINYTLGQGAIVYFVHRTHGVPVLRGTGAVLLVMGVNVLLLLLLSTVGLVFAPEVPPMLKTVLAIAYAGLAVYVALVAAKPRWLRDRPVFDILLNAGIRGHLKAMAVRVPHLLSLVVLSYGSMRGFGIKVPFGQAVMLLPVAYFIAVLPISPAGLGTTQAAMTTLFARYAEGPNPAAVILACSLTAQAVAMVVQASIGAVCLRHQIARDIGSVK